MITGQQFELITVKTGDGITLHGGLVSSQAKQATSFDAAILMHGAGANFYSAAFYRQLSGMLCDLGINVLAVNNRGHDGLYGTTKAGLFSWQGAAYEHVGSTHQDIDAWIQLAQQRGFKRIVLIGHSLGAIKVLLSQAYHPNNCVKGIVASSPPCLSYQRFMESKRANQFKESFSTAQQNVAEGKELELIRVSFPFPMWISATNYVDKYGPQENYNILRFADLIKIPILFTYGELELQSNISFQGLDEQLTEKFQGRSAFELKVVPGADHFYTGVDELLSSEVQSWFWKST